MGKNRALDINLISLEIFGRIYRNWMLLKRFGGKGIFIAKLRTFAAHFAFDWTWVFLAAVTLWLKHMGHLVLAQPTPYCWGHVMQVVGAIHHFACVDVGGSVWDKWDVDSILAGHWSCRWPPEQRGAGRGQWLVSMCGGMMEHSPILGAVH